LEVIIIDVILSLWTRYSLVCICCITGLMTGVRFPEVVWDLIVFHSAHSQPRNLHSLQSSPHRISFPAVNVTGAWNYSSISTQYRRTELWICQEKWRHSSYCPRHLQVVTLIFRCGNLNFPFFILFLWRSINFTSRVEECTETNSVAPSPQANYTDWATATCRRNLVPTFVDRGVSRGERGGSPTVVILSFLDRSRSFSFK
jgi:hypothetical protein